MNKKKRKKKIRAVFLLIFLVVLAVYGGIKSGEYLANKLSKPIVEDSSALEGTKTGSSTGDIKPLSENDMVTITSTLMEFVEAEHMKKTELLANMVSSEYYSTFTKGIKSLSTAEALVQDTDFKEVSKDKAVIEVTYIKNGKKGIETVTMELIESRWKVTGVKR